MLGMLKITRIAVALIALTLVGVAGLGGAASAQQPTRVNPTESSVKEQQLLDALKGGGQSSVSGRVSIPDARSRDLIQPGGQDWRGYRDTTLPRVGLISILGMLAALVVFLVVRGRVRVDGGFSGQLIERFGSVERFGHWLVASSFIVLALTGLNVTFGRQFLLPIVGPETFTNISQIAKYLHNYMSFAFVLGLVMIFVMWVVYNLPMPSDIKWIAQGGGLFGKNHPPAGRFNAGQKMMFWITIWGGLALSVTGYGLMFPFYTIPLAVPLSGYGSTIAGIQTLSMVHGLVGVLMIAAILAHIYIGTVGMQGAISAMWRGKVDTNWARQHHSIWAERVLGKAVAPSHPAPKHKPTPAE